MTAREKDELKALRDEIAKLREEVRAAGTIWNRPAIVIREPYSVPQPYPVYPQPYRVYPYPNTYPWWGTSTTGYVTWGNAAGGGQSVTVVGNTLPGGGANYTT